MKIQYKKNYWLKGIELVLALAGLIVLIIALVLLIKTISFDNKSEVVQATVDLCDKNTVTDSSGKISINYITYVSYTYNGQSYNHILVTGLNEEKIIGELIQIRINVDNPTDARFMNQTTFIVALLLIVGIIFTFGMGYIFVISILNENEYKEIIKNGRKIEATITKIYPVGNVYNSRNQYYQLECESMEKTFTSALYKNGEDIQEGNIVPVYYTSLNKNKYFVDIENTIINKKQEDNWRFK